MPGQNSEYLLSSRENASQMKQPKFLAFFVKDKGAPVVLRRNNRLNLFVSWGVPSVWKCEGLDRLQAVKGGRDLRWGQSMSTPPGSRSGAPTWTALASSRSRSGGEMKVLI